MAFSIKVLNSCKFLQVKANRYSPNATTADVVITEVESNASYTAVMTYTNNGKGKIIIPISNLASANGVFEVCIVEGGVEQVCAPVLIHCNIDCCLTKLTNELLDCACDCPKCATSLAKAQKIYLLLKSAEAAESLGQSTENTGYLRDIVSKYNKAKEICDNSCGCDC